MFFKTYQYRMLFDICRNINETDIRDVFFTLIKHFIGWSDCLIRYDLQTLVSSKTLHSATDAITRTFSMTTSKKIPLSIHSKVSFVMAKVGKVFVVFILRACTIARVIACEQICKICLIWGRITLMNLCTAMVSCFISFEITQEFYTRVLPLK